MKTLHFPWSVQLYHGEANTDLSPESPLRKEGSVLDAQNMRPSNLDGHFGDREKIHGEALKWANVDNRPETSGCTGGTGLAFPLTYCCIANYQVLNHIVEFWADETGVGLPYVRVDGWIVVYPKTIDKFPISYSYPPQVHGNNSCVGGEVFYTDDHIPPFILNVTDLLENAGINPANNLKDGTFTPTAKYFCSFDITQYQIQPPAQADHPQFIEIVPTGSTPNQANGSVAVTHGTGGMKTGQYQYAIQYVDSSGNTSNWSEMCPQIPVPYSQSFSEPVYPSTKVYGGSAGNISLLGIHLRFRITNTNNFASINIRRLTWDVGAALGTLPNDDSVIQTVNLTDGQIGIVDFYDYDNSTIEPITQAASTQSNLSAIQAAKSIRYYDSRLTLWNITYASRDLSSSSISFSTTNNTMYPFVRPLGQQGYKDIWNDVYRKSYFRGEQYGFALVAFDSTGNPTFAIPIPGSNASFPSPNTFSNFRMPNRRDQLTGASLTSSVEVANTLTNPVPLTSAVNSTGSVTTTYEVFDMVNAVQRDSSNSSLSPSITPISIIDDKHTPQKNNSQNPSVYNPFRPVNDNDSSNNFAYTIDASVNDGSGSDPSIGNGKTITHATMPPMPYPGFLPYNPRGFLPNLYALGMCLSGVSNIPNWVASFAIVRTSPAGRILAQGQGYYNFNASGGNPPSYNSNNTNKDTNGYIWDSPDFYTGVSNVNNIISNLSRFKMQIVSPLGFFSEVYHGYAEDSDVIGSVPTGGGAPSFSYDREIDMISYCRILTDSGEFNPINSGLTMVGIPDVNGKRFVSFSSWRNGANSITANEEFPFSYFNNIFSGGYSVTAGSAPRRSAYYWKSSGAGIYANGTTSGAHDYRDSGVKNWHEPVYVSNVVDDSQNVTSSLVQDYFQTGCFIKMSSIIGQVPNAIGINPPSFLLVDERWQDCIPSERKSDSTAGQDRYVWIQDTNNNVKAWLNVTYKTLAQITAIVTAISSSGFYVSTRCDGTTVNVYGIYSHSIVTYTNGNLTSAGEKSYQIVFDQKDNSGNYMIPDPQSYVIVKYDSCAPIEVFGGDTFIGDYTYPVADCVYTSDADPTAGLDNFIIDRPLPYRAWQINENTLIIHDNDPIIGSLSIQGYNLIRFFRTNTVGVQESSYVRQLLVNGILESRTNTSLFFGSGNSYTESFFPNVNYVMRPIQWRKWSTNIQSGYTSDYPDEGGTASILGYGGFRINPIYNIDYSEYPTQDKSYSKPTSGFTERLNFCSRVLWSDARSTNEQNAPNLKNFPSTNIFDFDDVTGEIKRAWDSSVGKEAGNLYAFTERGIVMALTEKNILTEVSGNQLAVTGNSEDTFIQGQVWLSKDIGMNDQMWRGAAEYNNGIWFPNNLSIYRLRNNELEDLGSPKYGYAKTIRTKLDNISSGYGSDVTGVYNTSNDEYWLCLNPHRIIASFGGQTISLISTGAQSPPATYLISQDSIVVLYSATTSLPILNLNTINTSFVTELFIQNETALSVTIQFGTQTQTIASGQILRAIWNGSWALDTQMDNFCNDLIWNEGIGWTGQFKYRFDKYTVDTKGTVYGSRLGATYALDNGYTMNGANVQAWVSSICSPKEEYSTNKEFIRVRSSSNFVPDTISFFTSLTNYNSNTAHSQIASSTPFALKNYGGVNSPGWEGYIPRGSVSPFYRNQGHYTIYTISYAGATDWWISSSEIQFKELKA